MHKVRDQQGIFISSSKNHLKTNSSSQSKEGKEQNKPNYLSPTTSFLAKMNPNTSPQESETVQRSMHENFPIFEGLIDEQYHSVEFIFLEVPIEAKDNPQREMKHRIFKEETSSFRFSIKRPNEETKMKNIPHSASPNFHGLCKEYPETFLFEFDVLCRSYDYVLDA